MQFAEFIVLYKLIYKTTKHRRKYNWFIYYWGNYQTNLKLNIRRKKTIYLDEITNKKLYYSYNQNKNILYLTDGIKLRELADMVTVPPLGCISVSVFELSLVHLGCKSYDCVVVSILRFKRLLLIYQILPETSRLYFLTVSWCPVGDELVLLTLIWRILVPIENGVDFPTNYIAGLSIERLWGVAMSYPSLFDSPGLSALKYCLPYLLN